MMPTMQHNVQQQQQQQQQTSGYFASPAAVGTTMMMPHTQMHAQQSVQLQPPLHQMGGVVVDNLGQLASVSPAPTIGDVLRKEIGEVIFFWQCC